MFKTGLYINDLSMHDSSRDLVLAGTQQSEELKRALIQVPESVCEGLYCTCCQRNNRVLYSQVIHYKLTLLYVLCRLKCLSSPFVHVYVYAHVL